MVGDQYRNMGDFMLEEAKIAQENSSALVGLGGVVLGFLLSLIPTCVNNKRRKDGCIKSLTAEIILCGSFADTYLTDKIMSPLYRLPVAAWQNSYPVLLSMGQLTDEQTASLHKFYNAVETFNRGLDQINAAIGDTKKLSDEQNRLELKANGIASSSCFYKNAFATLAHLQNGGGKKMVERLGNVIFWLALLLAGFGFCLPFSDGLSDGFFNNIALGTLIATAALLTGWSCRYILSGNRSFKP